jgi:hypothetical protein
MSRQGSTSQPQTKRDLFDDLRQAVETCPSPEWKRRAQQALAVIEQGVRGIAEPDPLVEANADAFSVHAYRRCQQVAQYLLGDEGVLADD